MRGGATVSAPLAAAALMLLVAGASSCARKDEAQAARERVLVAVRALRDAPNPQKQKPLKKLEAVQCEPADDACQLKAMCVDAYRGFVAAESKVAAVRENVAAKTASKADLVALEDAMKVLKTANGKARRCADRQHAMENGTERAP